MEQNDIILIDGKYYKLRYRHEGCSDKDDEGLWRALHVDEHDWGIHDDDDYMISDDGRVIAVEIGWDLRREPVKKIYNREWTNVTKGERHILLIEEYQTAEGIGMKKINETVKRI